MTKRQTEKRTSPKAAKVLKKKTPPTSLPKMDGTFRSFMKNVSAVNRAQRLGLPMNELRTWLRVKAAEGVLEYDRPFFAMSYGKKNHDHVARAVIYLASVYLEPKGECFIRKNADGGRSAFIVSPRLANEVKGLLREDFDVDTATATHGDVQLHSIGVVFPSNRKLKTFGGNRVSDVIDQFRAQSSRTAAPKPAATRNQRKK